MSTYPQPSFVPPPGACQILLVRHGQSEAFVDGQPFDLVDGHGDPHLSPRGRWQAERVGNRLADESIDAIYVSSLTRTHQTAAPIAAHHGLEPRVERDLREVYLGEWEGGMLRKHSAEDHPIALEMRRTGDYGTIPGAESNEQLRQRTVSVIERVSDSHPDQFVVVVCHGGVIGALLGHATGQPLWVFGGSRNAAFSHLVVTPERWIVRSFNDASHVGTLTIDQDPN